jgi:hypothetical protein
MQNRRLIVGQIENFHFSWMNDEFRKHFREVIVTSNPWFPANEDDVLLVNACLGSFYNLACKRKFGILLPGFGFHPYKRPEQFNEMKPVFAKYDAIFCDEAPVGEAVKRDGTCKNFHYVPICANSCDFKKTRKREKFRKIIQVASHGAEKGRDVSKQAMKLLPYECELIPRDNESYFQRSQEQMIASYQEADGFLHPGRVGPAPGYFVDAKYTVSLIEAALSGCIIFWHDAMNHGNSMETVFEVSLDPKEIADKIQQVVGSIDLDAHSTKTANEFRDKYSTENNVKRMMDIMVQWL